MTDVRALLEDIARACSQEPEICRLVRVEVLKAWAAEATTPDTVRAQIADLIDQLTA